MKITKGKLYQIAEMYVRNVIMFTLMVIVLVGFLMLLGESFADFTYFIIGILIGGAVLTIIDYTK